VPRAFNLGAIMDYIKVVAPAHLHVGNIDLTGDLGRLYGTVGFTIDYPRTVVEIECSEKFTVIGRDSASAVNYARKALKFLGLEDKGAYVRIKEAIPKHVGLGSQTALALSIGLGLAKLYGVKVDIKALALALGRSTISALGLYSFTKGGFIVDGGFKIEKKEEMIPPLIFNYPIPDDWFFVVAIPQKPLPRILSIKSKEKEILDSLKPMPKEFSGKVSRIVLMQMLPAMVEKDIKVFGKAITLFNKALGEFWREKQGGIYCDPIVEEGIELLLKEGAYGACQTSWGPTFYGLVKGESKAKELAELLKKFIYKKGGGYVFYTKGNNRGALIVLK